MSYQDPTDRYERFAEAFDPIQTDRQARKKRKTKAHHVPKKSREDQVDEVADVNAVETEAFNITYNPSLHEAQWLMQSLRPFFEQTLITDVLALVKGGKEASVYCCAAHPSLGVDYLAAKVYRPRQFRTMRDDAIYREGRGMIGADGKKIRENSRRAVLAVEKKSDYGQLVAQTSWLMHEFAIMQQLRNLDLPVPQAYASGDNALLIEYIGDLYEPAPTLSQVRLDEREAQPLFEEALRSIEQMLAHEIVHGDLSAYNILYWDGQITLIDFPQVINPHTNSNTYNILQRDIQRVCDYFSKQGADCDAGDIMRDLWTRYLAPNPEERAADLSRLEEDDEEG